MKPIVSVIIPHKNNSDKLKLCIDALSNQSYPKDLYEIIVVDNGSEDFHSENVLKLVKQKNFILLNELRTGSYAARNKGLRIAKGEYIAFTDSDCIPNSNWVEKGVNELKDDNTSDIVAGNIELFFKDYQSPNSIELFEKIFSYKQNIHVRSNFAATANVFTKKEVISNVGFFNEDLKSTGDKEWCQRARGKGYKIKYCKDLIIRHPARNNLKDIIKRQIRLCGGNFMVRKLNGTSKLNLLLINFFNFIPPIIIIYNLIKDEQFTQIESRLKRIKLILLIILLKYIRVYEIFRLLLGFKARSY